MDAQRTAATRENRIAKEKNGKAKNSEGKAKKRCAPNGEAKEKKGDEAMRTEQRR